MAQPGLPSLQASLNIDSEKQDSSQFLEVFFRCFRRSQTPTSDMKMIDIWLIFCLVVPFLEVIIRTAIECASCSCHICEPKDKDNDKDNDRDKDKDKDNDKDKDEEEERKARAGPLPLPGPSPTVWVTTGSKVAPQNSQQVNKQHLLN